MQIWVILHAFLKYKIKHYCQWCKFWDILQNINVSLKKQGWFYPEFYNSRQLKYESCFFLSIKIVLKYNLKAAPLKRKIFYTQYQLSKLIKTVDFEQILL